MKLRIAFISLCLFISFISLTQSLANNSELTLNQIDFLKAFQRGDEQTLKSIILTYDEKCGLEGLFLLASLSDKKRKIEMLSKGISVLDKPYGLLSKRAEEYRKIKNLENTILDATTAIDIGNRMKEKWKFHNMDQARLYEIRGMSYIEQGKIFQGMQDIIYARYLNSEIARRLNPIIDSCMPLICIDEILLQKRIPNDEYSKLTKIENNPNATIEEKQRTNLLLINERQKSYIVVEKFMFDFVMGNINQAKKIPLLDVDKIGIQLHLLILHSTYVNKSDNARLEFYKNILNIFPKNKLALKWLARFYAEKEKYTEAIECLYRSENQNDGEVYYLLGMCKAQLNDLDGALKDLRKAGDLKYPKSFKAIGLIEKLKTLNKKDNK